MFKKMQNRKGFTLIEMMAVIAIVAVLVAITIPTVTKARVKAQAASDAANLRSLSASIATRYVSTTDFDELSAGLSVPKSQLRESPLVLVYVTDEKEIQSYYADSLVGYSANYRGLPYNATVTELGQTEGVPYDTPEGTLICFLGTGDYADKTLVDSMVEDYINYVWDAGQEAIAAVRKYYQENTDAIKQATYANAMVEASKQYDCDGNLTGIKLPDGTTTTDEDVAYTAWQNDYKTNTSTNLGSIAADAMTEDVYVTTQGADIAASSAAASAGALKDMAGILADTSEGQEYLNSLKETNKDVYNELMNWINSNS